MNQITPRIALEIAHHEAIIRQTYKDSGGVNTWSVGLTSATGHNVDRYIGRPQPMEHCLSIYLWALGRYARQVREVMPDLTEAQFAAALSFHWNTGAIKKATWVKKWNKGDEAGARKAFMSYRKPASIISRREAERDLFFDGLWSGNGKMAEYTRVTSRMTPDWGSRITVDVGDEIRALLTPITETIEAHHAPEPTQSWWRRLIRGRYE